MRTLITVLVLALLVPAAAAQERTPTPKELWDAYPLDAPQTPTAAPTTTVIAIATPAPTADGGLSPAVPIGIAALVAAAGGFALLRRRRAHAALALEPPAPLALPQPAAPEPVVQRFDWRTYPPPARPAPPAPGDAPARPSPERERTQ